MRRRVNGRRAYKVLKPQLPVLVVYFTGGDLHLLWTDPILLPPIDDSHYAGTPPEGYTFTCQVDGNVWRLHIEGDADGGFVLEYTAPYKKGLLPPSVSNLNDHSPWTQTINSTGDDMVYLGWLMDDSTLALGN